LSEVQADAARIQQAVQARHESDALAAWARVDHAPDVFARLTRVAAADRWAEYFYLHDAWRVYATATERVRDKEWWPWLAEAWAQRGDDGTVDPSVPAYAVAALLAWAQAVTTVRDAMAAADAVLAT